MNIMEFVGKNNKVTFSHYRAGMFYYYVPRLDGTEVYTFPVPADDVGNGTLLNEDKAITYMRWIRRAISDNTLIKEEE